jgi:hypothetical protein
MADPKKFKPYYVVESFSRKQNKIRQHILATETERMKKLSNFDEAVRRCKEFTNSLNESSALGVNDWIPMLHFHYEKNKKIPVNIPD